MPRKSNINKAVRLKKNRETIRKVLELNPPENFKTPTQQSAVDMHALAEYHFRRGLVSAMECILRELR